MLVSGGCEWPPLRGRVSLATCSGRTPREPPRSTPDSRGRCGQPGEPRDLRRKYVTREDTRPAYWSCAPPGSTGAARSAKYEPRADGAPVSRVDLREGESVRLR